MTWEAELFAFLDDLEQQAEAAYDAERAVELADRSRAEYHHVSLASRQRASVGAELVLDVRGTGPVRGVRGAGDQSVPRQPLDQPGHRRQADQLGGGERRDRLRDP